MNIVSIERNEPFSLNNRQIKNFEDPPQLTNVYFGLVEHFPHILTMFDHFYELF